MAYSSVKEMVKNCRITLSKEKDSICVDSMKGDVYCCVFIDKEKDIDLFNALLQVYENTK